MELFYTLHAEDQIQDRKIEKVWIEETIKFPDITRRKENKYYVIKRLNGKVLKVVYVRERYIKVITSYYMVK